MKPNKKEALHFIELLAGENTTYDWRIIHPRGPAKALRGALEDIWAGIESAAENGAGAFVMVNETDGNGQRTSNVVKIRAVFVDLDGAPLAPVLDSQLSPQVIVQSSLEKWHAYWLVDDDFPLEKFTAVQKAIAAKFRGDPSVNDLPRVMRLPGSIHTKGAPFCSHIYQVDKSLPRYSLVEVVEGLGLELETKQRGQRSEDQGQGFDVNRPLNDGQRTGALTSFVGKLICQGMEDDMVLAAVRAWNANNNPPLPDEKLVSTIMSIRKADNRGRFAANDTFGQLNKNHAAVMLGGKCVILDESQDEVVFTSVHDFKNYYASLPKIEGKNAAVYWMNHPERRQYKTVVFDPSGAANDDTYNLWRGFSVEPREGDCSLYLAHIKDNICCGNMEHYEYMLNWMADAAQNPSVLPGVAVVLQGKQGTGKGIFATEFGSLFGKHFKHVQSYDRLIGKFNAHLADASVIFCDEIIWGGNRKDAGPLKTLITEKARTVEYKGKDCMQVQNFSRVIMATNEEWAIPAAAEERRFFVLEVSDAKQQNTAYFESIRKQMAAGGREALLHMLLNRDISGYDVRTAPKTEALAYQKSLSLDSVGKWVYACLVTESLHAHGEYGIPQFLETGWPERVKKEELFARYASWCRGEGERYPAARNAFFRKLKTWIAGYSEHKETVEGQRVRWVSFSGVEDCIEHFREATGCEFSE